jgi:hypothetical protein
MARAGPGVESALMARIPPPLIAAKIRTGHTRAMKLLACNIYQGPALVGPHRPEKESGLPRRIEH